MVTLRDFVKAPKNIKEKHIIVRKYYHGIVSIVRAYNHVVGIFHPTDNPPAESPELDDVRARARQRTDISDHLERLFEESLSVKPALIVELGVGPGESSFVLEKVANISGGTLISVDRDQRIKKDGTAKHWYVNKDDIEFAGQFKAWCGEKGIAPLIDVLFIDTSHTYAHTVQEIAHWFPFLSKKGKVFFHDTNVKIIYHRLDGSIGITYDHEPRAVMRAIEEFLGCKLDETRDFFDIRNGWRIRHYRLCNGFTILEKI